TRCALVVGKHLQGTRRDRALEHPADIAHVAAPLKSFRESVNRWYERNGTQALLLGECLVLVAHQAVARAGHAFETLPILDRDHAAAVRDEAALTQLRRDPADRHAPLPEHLRQELLPQHEGVAAHAVLGHEKPARATLLG